MVNFHGPIGDHYTEVSLYMCGMKGWLLEASSMCGLYVCKHRLNIHNYVCTSREAYRLYTDGKD